MNARAEALRPTGSAIGVGVACAAFVALAGWAIVDVNRDRACALSESIAAAYCTPPAPGSAAEVDSLIVHISREPGDSNAYAALAVADRSPRRARIIELASQLAPRDPTLLLYRGAAAFDRGDWAAAIPPLVELLENRDVEQAALGLAWIVQDGKGSLLEPHVREGSHWLARLLAGMKSAKAALSGAIPLIVKGLRVGAIDVDTVREYVRELKAAGLWGDAFALWLSMHGGKGPLLFNASFDHAFETDGFDWEALGNAGGRRSGTIVERRPTEQRGSVVEVQLTGKPIQGPVLRQYLFITPGKYRLHGDFSARQLRMEQGFVWTVRCGDAEAGRSRPFREDGPWNAFDFEFTIPAQCGLVAALQLEPATALDAAGGGRGRVAFDAFTLEKTGS